MTPTSSFPRGPFPTYGWSSRPRFLPAPWCVSGWDRRTRMPPHSRAAEVAPDFAAISGRHSGAAHAALLMSRPSLRRPCRLANAACAAAALRAVQGQGAAPWALAQAAPAEWGCWNRRGWQRREPLMPPRREPLPPGPLMPPQREPLPAVPQQQWSGPTAQRSGKQRRGRPGRACGPLRQRAHGGCPTRRCGGMHPAQERQQQPTPTWSSRRVATLLHCGSNEEAPPQLPLAAPGRQPPNEADCSARPALPASRRGRLLHVSRISPALPLLQAPRLRPQAPCARPQRAQCGVGCGAPQDHQGDVCVSAAAPSACVTLPPLECAGHKGCL